MHNQTVYTEYIIQSSSLGTSHPLQLIVVIIDLQTPSSSRLVRLGLMKNLLDMGIR